MAKVDGLIISNIERFWRTLKYEEVYLKSYDSVVDAKENLAVYIDWYNTQRRHSGIGQKRPIDVLMDNCDDGYVDNSNELLIPTPSTSISIPGRLSISSASIQARSIDNLRTFLGGGGWKIFSSTFLY